MKLNKRMTFGIISIILAALVALIGIPAVIGQANAKTNIVRVKANIERGSVITAEQVEMVQVSANGLPDGVATEYTQILGKYALVDLVVGDYFLPTKVSSMSPDSDLILTHLPDGQIAVSMSVRTLAGSLSNKLRTNDIVGIYSETDDGIAQLPELQYLRIIAVSNADGTNLEDVTGDASRMAATITFLVTERQAQSIIAIESEGQAHLTLISRGDRERARALLVEQEEILADLAAEDTPDDWLDDEEAEHE